MADVQYEWGKLNVGQPYLITAIDVDRAIAHLRLGDYERPLLQYVREHSWGASVRRKRRKDPWPDAIPCELNLHALAREWGLPRQRLTEAKRSLVRDRIMVESDGLFTINKAGHEWAPGRFIGPGSLAYAASAQSSRGGTLQRSPGGTLQRAGGARQSVSTGTLERAGGARWSVPSHIDDRAQKDPTGFRLQKSVLSEHPPFGGTGGLVEDENGSIVPIAPTEAPDPAELHRVSELAERLFPMAGWDLEVGRWSALYPLAWIARALEVAAAGGKAVRWTYVLAILRRWQAEGGPEPAKVAARPAAGGNGAGKHAAIDRMAGWVPPSLRKEKP